MRPGDKSNAHKYSGKAKFDDQMDESELFGMGNAGLKLKHANSVI